MKNVFTGMPVSSAVSVFATADVCSWYRTAPDALIRTRAFAAVPAGPVTGEEVSPATGLPGSRPAGSPAPQRHVVLDPQRPRLIGRQPQG